MHTHVSVNLSILPQAGNEAGQEGVMELADNVTNSQDQTSNSPIIDKHLCDAKISHQGIAWS